MTEQPEKIEGACRCRASQFIDGAWYTQYDRGDNPRFCMFCGDYLDPKTGFAHRMVRAEELTICQRALELLAKISPLENADNELAQARAEAEGGGDEHTRPD